MRITNEVIRTLTADVEGTPCELLTYSNPKTAKSEGYGYLTAILHLAPFTLAGPNVCPAVRADDPCVAVCINQAGRAIMDPRIARARVRRTRWLKANRHAFIARLEREIAAHVRRAVRNDLLPAVRLNGTSDLPWHRLGVIDSFPDVTFYDYTKVASRFEETLPANYRITFSWSGHNAADTERVLRANGTVAVIFRNAANPRARARDRKTLLYWPLPTRFLGFPVIDGDNHDLIFLDSPGTVRGLRAKGLAWTDTSGFVVDSNDPRTEGE